ncbi:MFS general substrate transporter [Coprinellus micaceus]|uniref:MFS general substrate transporter n=1 Tax=Coprinellus micaceus TaxID=71717 RepID=A0A4Y7T5T2_COPMI|nr:MFS general substrate transporter [Coprinellus micaceus]
MTHEHPPPTFSLPRITTLLVSLLVALGSGTNYVYSAYAPQMGAKLNITHTALNIVALAGNIGVYTTGPIWGRIVDSRGPRILLGCGFAFLLGGYLGIRHLYDGGLAEKEDSISLLGFCALVICSYLTGAGGNGGLTSSTFPDHMRGITTGLVISGFGLSAFLFSSISRSLLAGNTSSFLLLLAVGTSLPMIIGFFLIRPIPLDHNEKAEQYEPVSAHPDHLAPGLSQRNDSQSPLLEVEEENSIPRTPGFVGEAGLAPDRAVPVTHDTTPNVHGLKLWKSPDFYLLFSILSLLSGTGIMYINNVGSMSQALYSHNNPHYDPVESARWQSTQVSSISLMNCAGRIVIGVISDFAKNRFDIPRSYCLVVVSIVACISQLITAHVDNVADLWIASSALGLGYGAVFSLLPTVCLEWFGMPHFSENWGYLSLSPMIGGNLFSLVFGYNLDNKDEGSSPPSHKPVSHVSRLVTRGGLPSNDIRCSNGLGCYKDSIYMTIAATVLALGLSIWASVRDRKKIRKALLKRRGENETREDGGEY